MSPTRDAGPTPSSQSNDHLNTLPFVSRKACKMSFVTKLHFDCFGFSVGLLAASTVLSQLVDSEVSSQIHCLDLQLFAAICQLQHHFVRRPYRKHTCLQGALEHAHCLDLLPYDTT